MTVQFYSPGYLFFSPRPEITDITHDELPYGDEFTVLYDTQSVVNGVDHVVLMKPSSTSNNVDTDQRRLELEFEILEPGALCIQTPPNNDDAPPGYYMLFILEDRQGGFGTVSVPSEALWVEVEAGAANTACGVPQ